MVELIVKNGYNLNIAGRPVSEVSVAVTPNRVAMLPERIPYIKPKLLVKEGESVALGAPVFCDKRDKRIWFPSPGGGRVEKIVFGPRRVIQAIVIALEADEAVSSYPGYTADALRDMDRSELVTAILERGGWHVLKSLPFRDIASPEEIPPAIRVCLDNDEPFHPEARTYLEGKGELLQYGLTVLSRLCDRVQVSMAKGTDLGDQTISSLVTHRIRGPYPANDPGVWVYHAKKDPRENRSWYVAGQDLLYLAALLKDGRSSVDRFVTVAGSAALERRTVQTRIGAPVADLVKIHGSWDRAKLIAGGIFRGYEVNHDDYLGWYETGLVAVPRGGEKEFFGFARPGANKPSYSRTFLSVFKKAPFNMDCGMHGEERACVNCSSCADVCPVDMLPQFTMKAIYAGEVEEALEHGMLDCVCCGLCSYVCPSKIDLTTMIKHAREDYYKESA